MTRSARKAARKSKREANRRERELTPNRVRLIPDLPPLFQMQEFAASLRLKYADPDGADLHDAVDDFIDWVDDQIEYEIGDGPLANAAEALLEALDGPTMRGLAKQLIQGAARLPVNDRRHP